MEQGGSFVHPQGQKFHMNTSVNVHSDSILTSAIKKGGVKSYIKKGAGSLSENLGQENQDSGLESHLFQLKNSCCDLSKQIRRKQQHTDKFKDEAIFVLDKAKKLKEQRLRLEDKINSLQKSLDQVSSKRDSAFHCSKIYEHILQRMKKDSIHNQLKKNQLTRQLRNLDKTYNYAEAKQYSLIQLERLSLFGVKDAQEEFGDQKLSRKHKLSGLEESNIKKRELAEKLKARQSQTDQIQEMAAGDLQDADVMRLKKFLTVQIFLKDLLKSKISKLKKYYEPYEIIFYQIKSRTHVKDANSLKNQFFNFENSYNEKTEWVKVLEEELNEAEQEGIRLKNQLKQLSNQEIQILEDIENKTQPESSSFDKRQFAEKSIKYELSMQRIKTWINLQCKKMKINPGSDNAQQMIKDICHVLKEKKEKKKAQMDEEKMQESKKQQELQVQNKEEKREGQEQDMQQNDQASAREEKQEAEAEGQKDDEAEDAKSQSQKGEKQAESKKIVEGSSSLPGRKKSEPAMELMQQGMA